MFDSGVHPAFSGLASLPYFDEIDPSKIDRPAADHTLPYGPLRRAPILH